MNNRTETFSEQELYAKISSIAKRYYKPEYHNSILQHSRIKLLTKLLYLLNLQGKSIEEISVLDIGCGMCDLLLLLKELGMRNLVGVNLFPLNKSVFRSNVDNIFGNKLGKIKYIEMDVEEESLQNLGRFDCVLLYDVLEHLYNPDFTLKEISRILKQDGYIVIRTPNGSNLAKRVRLMFGKSSYHDINGWLYSHRFLIPKFQKRKFQGHMREYNLEELKIIFKIYNLNILHIKLYKSENIKNVPRLFHMFYNVLEILYPRFAYQIGVIGVKRS